MNEELKQLERRINELEKKNALLEKSATIPLKIDQAFRERFPSSVIKLSSKDYDSEDVNVDEGGGGVYDVLGDPDKFLEVVIDETIYYIPAFT